jgi:hypothetical protein
MDVPARPARRPAAARLAAVVSILLPLAAPLAAQDGFPHRVTGGLADLRPEGFDAESPAARERGRALLERAVARHGGDAWARHETLTVTATDAWKEPGPWWPQQNQRARFLQLLGTFTSRVTFLDGPEAGEVWGIQSWWPYKAPGEKAEAVFLVEDLPIQFYLPTLQYFNELPFRLARAPLVADLGPAELFGVEYDRVFVTWGSSEPHEDADQYVLWIKRSSGLVAKAHYTLREAARMSITPEEQRPMMRAGAAGTIHYGDYRDVDGVWLPFRQLVTLFGPQQAGPDPEAAGAWMHRLTLESATFDAAPREALLPDPALPPPADAKPESRP